MRISDEIKIRRFNVLASALFAIGLGVWLSGMPAYLDDWWYMQPLRGWYESQGIVCPAGGGDPVRYGMPLEEIVISWSQHFHETNTRIGNMLLPVFLMFPKWLGSAVSWLAILYGFGTVLRLAGIGWRRSLLLPVGLALWMFMLPWRDHMGSLAFQFGYLLPTAFVMATASGVWKRKGGVWNIFLTFLTALLAGWGHEGIAGPAFCGLAALPLFYRGFRNRTVYWALGGMLCGLIVLASSPGMWGRVAQSGGQERFTVAWVASVGLICLPYIMAALVWLLLIAGHRRKALLQGSFLTFMMTGGMVSCLLVCVSDTTPRAGWWACFSAVGALLAMLRICGGRRWERFTVPSVTVAALCAVVVTVHLASVDMMTVRIRRAFDAGLAGWLDADMSEPAVFGDVPAAEEMPLSSLLLPDDVFFTRGLRTVGLYYGYDPETRVETRVPFGIVPRKLRGVAAGADTAVRREGDWFYIAADALGGVTAEGYADMEVDYGSGFVPKQVHAVMFESEADGRRYYWLVPVEGWYTSRFRRVRAIR